MASKFKSIESAAPSPTATQHEDPKPPAKKKRVRVMTDRRREQCRRNQTRYRLKQKEQGVELEDTVEQLRLYVQQLEDQRRGLQMRIHTSDAAVKLVVEYFRLFRYGLLDTDDRAPPRVFTLAQTQRFTTLHDQQRRYLQTMFHPSIRLGDAIGLDSFVEQNRRFSVFYDGLVMELGAIHSESRTDTCTILTASVKLEMTVTTTTLRFVFPHLLHPAYHRIKWKLLGQRLHSIAMAQYVLDTDGLVIEVDWTVDFVRSLQQILTVEETALVLQQAQIVSDAYLLCDGEEHQNEREQEEQV